MTEPVAAYSAVRSVMRLLAPLVLLGCTARETSQSADTINRPFTVGGVRVEPDSLNAYLAAKRGFTSRGGEMRCAYRPLSQHGTRVFVWALCTELLAADGHLVNGSAMSLPAAFEIKVDNGQAYVVGVEVPEDGSGYGQSIRRIFPAATWPTIFANGTRDGLEDQLRVEAAARFGLPLAAASEPRRHDPPSPYATLDSSARRVVEFLRGKASFEQIALSDTVTLFVSPEGGGGRTTFARDQLRQPSAWRVRSGGRVISLAPPAGLTRLTTKVGRHFNCAEQSLASKFPRLAQRPHVGTVLAPENASSCLQTWNVTFVFDTGSRPRLVAAVYDQWEW